MQKNRTMMSKVFDALVIIIGLCFVVLGLEDQEWMVVALGAVVAASGIGLWIILEREFGKRNLDDSNAAPSEKRP